MVHQGCWPQSRFLLFYNQNIGITTVKRQPVGKGWHQPWNLGPGCGTTCRTGGIARRHPCQQSDMSGAKENTRMCRRVTLTRSIILRFVHQSNRRPSRVTQTPSRARWAATETYCAKKGTGLRRRRAHRSSCPQRQYISTVPATGWTPSPSEKNSYTSAAKFKVTISIDNNIDIQ